MPEWLVVSAFMICTNGLTVTPEWLVVSAFMIYKWLNSHA